MNRVLVIDDDVELCELVQEYLEPEGFDLETIHHGEAGLQRAASGDYVLIILDVMLPGLGGFEILRRLRAAKEPAARTPVLMLTARGDDVDRIVGLELGADDYLPKPFNPRELVARIHAILRRTLVEPEAAITAPVGIKLSVGDIELDTSARTVRRGGESLELTTVEFDLLAVLLRTAGRVVTRDEMVREVFGRKFTSYDRSVDMHVSNLRKKLGLHPDGEERIKTVRSAGYIYAVYAPGSNAKA